MNVWMDFDQDPKVRDVLQTATGTKFDSCAHCWLASVDDNRNVLGGLIYSDFSATNCQLTVAVLHPSAVSRRFLRVYFGLPFLQLGLRRVTAVVSVNNQKSLDLCKRLGFEFEAHLRGWFEDGDAHQLVMFRDSCPWIPHDEKSQSSRSGSNS